MSLSATDHLLMTTRAVRRRLDLDRSVDSSLLLECIAIAQQAPTAGNSQSWGFVVVRDAPTRLALANHYRAVAIPYLEAARAAAPDSQTKRVYESALHLAEILDQVPVHVIPCVAGSFPSSNFEAASLYGSILPATWSLMLAMRARGLGSAFTTLHLGREQEVAELLGIPEGILQVGLLPVAHYTGTDFVPAKRPPASHVTHWNRWEGPMDNDRPAAASTGAGD